MNLSPFSSRLKFAAAIPAIAALATLLFAGCGDDAPREASAGPTAVDHQAEARQNITADNMDRVLQDLESEIEADTTSSR
jgi:hypothetical protein